MNRDTKLKFNLSRLNLCLLAALSTYTAQAQQEQETQNSTEVERISVIGSNIKRATDISAWCIVFSV